MKKKLLIVLFMLLHFLGGIYAHVSVISCSFRNTPLVDVLKRIQDSSPKSINYVHEELEPFRVTLQLNKATVKEALRIVSSQLPLTVVEEEDAFYVTIHENATDFAVTRSHWLPMIVVDKEKNTKIYNKVQGVKLCLSFPRKNYQAGDSLLFCARTLNPDQWTFDYRDQVLYVSLYDNYGISQVQTQLVRNDGSFSGGLCIPRNLPTGQYWLTAYSESMYLAQEKRIPQYTISIENPIMPKTFLPAQNVPSVKFYPEGSSLVAGADQRVAYRAMWANGSPIDMNGVVVNSSGDTICGISESHDGMGWIDVPASALTDTTQRLILIARFLKEENDSLFIQHRFLLPRTLKRSHTMRLLHTDYMHHLTVHIEEISDIKSRDSLTIAIYDKSRIYYARRINSASKNLDLNIAECAPGIKYIGLFSMGKELISEIPFLKMFEETPIQLEVEQEKVNQDSIRLFVWLKDTLGNTVLGDYSVSLSKNILESSASYLLSDLLLRSELPDYRSDICDSIFSLSQREKLDLFIQTGSSFMDATANKFFLRKKRFSLPQHCSTGKFEKWYGKDMFSYLPESALKNAKTLVTFLSDISYSQDHNALRGSNESNRVTNSYNIDGSPASIPYPTNDMGGTYPANKAKDRDMNSYIPQSYIIPKLQIVDSLKRALPIKQKDLKKISISEIDHIIVQLDNSGQGYVKLFMASPACDYNAGKSLQKDGTILWIPSHVVEPLILTVDTHNYKDNKMFLHIEGFTLDGRPVSFDKLLNY